MMIRFLRCSNIALHDIRLCESAAWTTAFLDSSDISISRVSVRSVTNLNGDGFDFDGSHGIRVSDCTLNCSDDAICFQSGDYPTYDALVENCRISSLCCGVRVGMKSLSDIHDITVRNCVFDEVWREGLKIESTEGADIYDVTMSDCTMHDVRRPFWFLLNNDSVSIGSGVRPFGSLHDVTVSDINITCDEKMKQVQSYEFMGNICPMGFIGFDGSRIDASDKKKIENITFRNIDYTVYGAYHGDPPSPKTYPPVLDLYAGENGESSSNYSPVYSRAVFFDIRNTQNLVMDNITYRCLNSDVRPENIIEQYYHGQR